MFEFLYKVWYLIAILPFYIAEEGTDMFAKFLKKRGLYDHWDMWHTLIVVLIILAIVLRANGF